jgi:hypothetical protein
MSDSKNMIDYLKYLVKYNNSDPSPDLQDSIKYYKKQIDKSIRNETVVDLPVALDIVRPFPGPSQEAYGIYSEGRLMENYDPIATDSELKHRNNR